MDYNSSIESKIYVRAGRIRLCPQGSKYSQQRISIGFINYTVGSIDFFVSPCNSNADHMFFLVDDKI